MIIQEQPRLLVIGLKHNEFDTYDPEYYDHNNFDYIEEADNEIGMLNIIKHSCFFMPLHNLSFVQRIKGKYSSPLEEDFQSPKIY